MRQTISSRPTFELENRDFREGLSALLSEHPGFETFVSAGKSIVTAFLGFRLHPHSHTSPVFTTPLSTSSSESSPGSPLSSTTSDNPTTESVPSTLSFISTTLFEPTRSSSDISAPSIPYDSSTSQPTIGTTSTSAFPPSNTPSSISPSASQPPAGDVSSGTKQNNLARIIAGVLVPVLFLSLCGVAYVLYRRRRRARDRGEWERTHAEIADVVREAGNGELPAGLPAWSLSRVDTKVSPDIRGGDPTVVEKNGPAETHSSPSSMI